MRLAALAIVLAGCTSIFGLSDVGSSDKDRDGIEDDRDNCVTEYNPDQSNIDRDELGDRCDDCFAGDPTDNDQDGIPDVCDGCVSNGVDVDGDDIPDNCDGCFDPNNQCDPCFGDDGDGDGIPNNCDICNEGPNTDEDADGIPDLCDDCDGSAFDFDGDGVQDECDTCAMGTADFDQDGIQEGSGLACDTCNGANHDEDGDGALECTSCFTVGCNDNCPRTSTQAPQSDNDFDGLGNACDPRISEIDQRLFDGFGADNPHWYVTGSGWMITMDNAVVLSKFPSDRSRGNAQSYPLRVATEVSVKAIDTGGTAGLFAADNRSPYLAGLHFRCVLTDQHALQIIELVSGLQDTSTSVFEDSGQRNVELTMTIDLSGPGLNIRCVGLQRTIPNITVIEVNISGFFGAPLARFPGIGASGARPTFLWYEVVAPTLAGE